MIKVTVGEQKTQSEKPFPKLMKWGPIIVIVFKHSDNHYAMVELSEPRSEGVYYTVDIKGLIDYNEPITLQNA